MELHFEKEQMNDVFTKHHIKGLPFDAVIHQFSKKDKNEHIHDHPFSFTTHILKGSYIERIWTINEDGTYQSEEFHRKEGTSHRVSADLIHEIIDLPDGECFTLIRPEKWEQEVSFYRFDKNKSYKRKWNESQFKTFSQ